MKRPEPRPAFATRPRSAPKPLGGQLPSRGDGPPPAWLSVFEPPEPEPEPEPPAPRIDVAKLRAEIEAEAERAARARYDESCTRYLAGFQRLEQAVAEARRVEAETTVSLALVVARELCGHELKVDEHALREAIDRALHGGPDDVVRVRVSPRDFDRLKVEPLVSDQVSLEPDPALAPGGFVVESDREVLDASVESRLEALRAGLIDVLRASEREGG